MLPIIKVLLLVNKSKTSPAVLSSWELCGSNVVMGFSFPPQTMGKVLSAHNTSKAVIIIIIIKTMIMSEIVKL